MNVLSKEKQIIAISALAEGSSIRSLERITGVHRDTIMRLGARVGNGCQKMLDQKMRGLNCRSIEVDELWTYIQKKQARTSTLDHRAGYGDAWTFLSIDPETKLMPSFLVGKRDRYHAIQFMQDLASRLNNRIQLSTDALRAYPDAVEIAFGADVDYGQIVKEYASPAREAQRKYSPATLVAVYKSVVNGVPNPEKVCTSYIERANLTMRLHCKRLARLTLAFSKKFENLRAAIALHLAYYNFVKTHGSLRCTPAMAAGIESTHLTVENLLEFAA